MKYILFQRQISSLSLPFLRYFVLLVLISCTNCSAPEETKTKKNINNIELIPAPTKLLYKRGFFKLDKTTRLLLNLSDPTSKKIGEYLLNELKNKTNLQLKIADRFSTNKIKSSIELITEQIDNPNPEGYKIEITTDKIRIYASDQSGLFYGVNTVISLISTLSKATWQAPQLIIRDFPNTTYRALNIPLDSLPYPLDVLIQLLEKNRINHLKLNSNLKMPASFALHINVDNQRKVLAQNPPNKTSIKDFYHTKSSLDSVFFTIVNINQLNSDSLAIIGEAMWSKPSKLNYNRIINSLALEAKK